METLNAIIRKNTNLREKKESRTTLLAVCPNSEAVLAAAVKAAVQKNSIMLFAATLNQVDIDGGYTGWTQQDFVQKIRSYAAKYSCSSSLYPCLDHGGPWLKDKDTQLNLSFNKTFGNVKQSIDACINAGYSLLHIDPTVDRTLPSTEMLPVETIVDRTVELIAYAESVRERLSYPEIAYEVGTEEVHGGMVNFENFEKFIKILQKRMAEKNLSHIWPCFFVAQVGTDLHTTKFDSQAAKKIYKLLRPFGSLAKGHYTDWVTNPADYPKCGMGGANVGPEFTAVEFNALGDLEVRERAVLLKAPTLEPSKLIEKLSTAVMESNRWRKWLLDDEKGKDFHELKFDRKLWLLQTGSRYMWTDPNVVKAREILYKNLRTVMSDPNEYVVDRIVESIDKYLRSFNLYNSQSQYS